MPLPNLNREGELPEGVHQATLDEFIAGWQVKRDGTRRGIIEVRE